MIIKKHNKEAYDSIRNEFNIYNKVCSICPTETGKSYQALQLIRDNLDKHILYVTSLVSVKNRFISLAEKELNFTDFDAEIYSNLYKLGLDTYEADIIILDEFHRAGALTFNEYVLKLFETNPEAMVFGLTATPIRYLDDMRDMSIELFDTTAYELDFYDAIAKGILPDPEYVNCLIDKDALIAEVESFSDRGFLPADKEAQLESMLDKAKRKISEAPEIPEVLSKHVTKTDGRYIVFCPNIESVDACKERCREWFSRVNCNIEMYEVHSDIDDDMDETIDRFSLDDSSSLKLLFAVDMISEGVHPEGINGVIFLRATTSGNVFLQQMGRAFAVGGDERPLIIDLVNNISCLHLSDDFAEKVTEAVARRITECEEPSDLWDGIPHIHDYTTNIKDAFRQLRELRSCNTEDWLKACREYVAEFGNLLVPHEFVSPNGLKLGYWITRQRRKYKKGILEPELKNKLDEMGMVWIVNTTTTEDWLKACRKYVAWHGNLLVPSRYTTPEGMYLGRWIGLQRTNYKEGIIEPEVKEELDNLGMVWDAKAIEVEVALEKWLNACIEYIAEHGNLHVAQRYVTSDGLRLGLWLSHQRQKYRKGTISSELKTELEKLGIAWEPTVSEDEWLNACRNYIDEHGNFFVPTSYVSPDGLNLGYWLKNQRIKNKKGTISLQLKAELDKLGMVWSVSSNKIYKMKWIAACYKYVETHGNLLVPGEYVTSDGLKLGAWISVQRNKNKKGTLDLELKEQLDKLGMVWSMTISIDEWIGICKEYIAAHGNLLVPSKYVTAEGKKLGNWIRAQREKYKNGTIGPELKAELDELGMVWDAKVAVKVTNAEKYLSACRKYVLEHGNLNVPYSYISPNGLSLGRWLSKQRAEYKKGILFPYIKAELDKLGIEWGGEDIKTTTIQWIEACSKYVEKHGNLLVPDGYVTSDGLKLGSWIGRQRKKMKKGSIDQELKEQLDKLGMVWNRITPIDEWLCVCKEYIAGHGDLLVPSDYVTTDGMRLGSWIVTQRKKHRNGTIDPELKAELDKLGMVWKIRETGD